MENIIDGSQSPLDIANGNVNPANHGRSALNHCGVAMSFAAIDSGGAIDCQGYVSYGILITIRTVAGSTRFAIVNSRIARKRLGVLPDWRGRRLDEKAKIQRRSRRKVER